VCHANERAAAGLDGDAALTCLLASASSCRNLRERGAQPHRKECGAGRIDDESGNDWEDEWMLIEAQGAAPGHDGIRKTHACKRKLMP
jgi:hypothetical protein